MRSNKLERIILSEKNEIVEKATLLTIKILIADDHEIVRDGIRTMLESKIGTYNFEITEAVSGKHALGLIIKIDYDVVLMDYQFPDMNGADVVKEILLFKPQTKVLALSNYDEYSYISKMTRAGAKGYILKNIGPTELIKAILKIVNGRVYYSDDVSLTLFKNKEINRENKLLKKILLSKREKEVLKCITNEMSNEEIGLKLHIAKRTVDTHRQNILHKLGIKNTVSLVKYAFQNNLI